MKAAVLFLAGVLILPSVVAGSDFGVVSITSPPDTVRQHSVMAPAVLIHAAESNSGPELVSVQLRIGSSYLDTASAELAPGEDGVLPFATPWQADSLGAFPVRCSLLTSDSNPSNDTLSKVVTVLARRRDFAAIAMVLPSIVRRGDSVVPTATVHADDSNPRPETVAARLRIGSSYDDTVSKTLNPGASLPYSFKSWHADTLGTFPVRCSLLVQDSVPANDTISRSVTVLERLVDFAAEAMTTVPPIVHVTDMVTPVVTVHAPEGNPQSESVTAKVWIGASFTDTVRKLVPPGAHVTYQFKQWQAESVATFQYRCSLMVHDSFAFNDTMRVPITVYPQGSDFSVVNITSPPDSVTLDSEVVPTALVHAAVYNQSESVSVRMRIGTAYDHTKDTVVPAGDTLDVAFPTWHADSPGLFTARCSLLTPDYNPANDTGSKQVHVYQHSQPGGPPAVQWTKTFVGWGGAKGYCVQQTADGGYIAVGYTGSPDSTPENAALLVKLSASGDSQWVKTFKGVGGMAGSSVVLTSDGGFILAGSAAADERDGHWDPCLVKTDSLGNELWRSRLTNDVTARAWSVVNVGDTAYTVVARESFSDSGVILWRTDDSGNVRWRHAYNVRYGFGQNDEKLSLHRTSDGGYVIGTKTLLKVDSLGAQPQLKTFGSLTSANSVIQTSDGGYAATGEKDSSSIYLLKTNANRDIVWTHSYMPSEWSRGQWVEQTADGGYIICGTTRPGNGDDKVTLVRTSSNGTQMWTDTLSADYGYCVRQTSDGGYVVAGTSGGLFVTKLAAESRKQR
jgi:hypothetical protein